MDRRVPLLRGYGGLSLRARRVLRNGSSARPLDEASRPSCLDRVPALVGGPIFESQLVISGAPPRDRPARSRARSIDVLVDGRLHPTVICNNPFRATWREQGLAAPHAETFQNKHGAAIGFISSALRACRSRRPERRGERVSGTTRLGARAPAATFHSVRPGRTKNSPQSDPRERLLSHSTTAERRA